MKKSEDTPAQHARRSGGSRLLLSLISEFLITSGVVVLLFLVWQLWFNSLVVDGSQKNAAQEQSQTWIDEAASKPAVVPAAGSTVPAGLENIADYEPFAVIYIPALGTDWKRIIRETVDTEQVLNSYDAGVGHYKGTSMPGQDGNFAIAGHDSGWGNTFIDLSKLHIGDRAYVQTKDGWYTYEFRNFEFVQPNEVDVILPVPRNPEPATLEKLMTITTCNPPFKAGERLIAYTVFDDYAPLNEIPAEIAGVVQGGGS